MVTGTLCPGCGKCYIFRQMSDNPFIRLPVPKPDPIFAISAEALKAGQDAINGTIGVFMDENGETVLFPSVKKAIAEIAPTLPDMRYSYPPLLGLPEFRSAVEKLIFSDSEIHAASIATTAGTGALAVNLRLLKMLTDSGEIYLQSPAWANHPPPSSDAGFKIIEIPYLADGKASAGPLVEEIKKRKSRNSFAVLLQVGCHNPTGLDLSTEGWRQLADFLAGKPCTVLLDFAYQGFKDEPEKDREYIKTYLSKGIPTLISWSASKNHSIYSLRTGLACAVVTDDRMKETVEGIYSMITRRIHSAAATLGQKVVAVVQEKYPSEWRADLKNARKIMHEKRTMMHDLLPDNFKSPLEGFGLFAMLPISESQVAGLKKQNVFLTLDGRINIAGIPMKRIEELCEKIRKII